MHYAHPLAEADSTGLNLKFQNHIIILWLKRLSRIILNNLVVHYAHPLSEADSTGLNLKFQNHPTILNNL